MTVAPSDLFTRFPGRLYDSEPSRVRIRSVSDSPVDEVLEVVRCLELLIDEAHGVGAVVLVEAIESLTGIAQGGVGYGKLHDQLQATSPGTFQPFVVTLLVGRRGPLRPSAERRGAQVRFGAVPCSHVVPDRVIEERVMAMVKVGAAARSIARALTNPIKRVADEGFGI